MWGVFIFLFLLISLNAWTQDAHPIFVICSPRPNFELPGVGGKTHKLGDYSASPILVVVFTCNHCPIAQMHEDCIGRLAGDYKHRGVAVVAIQLNDPKAIRIDELDSSDISDSLAEMKIGAEYEHLQYPYVYDGDTQAVTRAYGQQATPLAFIFEQERRLRYEGRLDNSYRTEPAKTQEARDAIDAVLAHQEVAVKHTGVFGCSTKWQEKASSRIEGLRKIASQPVQMEVATAGDLKTLRTNPSKRMLLVSSWATWCGSCIAEFADLDHVFGLRNEMEEFCRGAANIEVIGRGPAHGGAIIGAPHIGETTGQRAAPHSGGGFRHGPLLDVNHSHVAIILALGRTADLGVSLAQNCLARGGRVILVDTEERQRSERLLLIKIASVPEPSEGPTSTIAPQAFTLAIAERTGAKLSPRFQYGVMKELRPA
jgi:thiol-disulfide isomerase/thioredoxin